MVGRVAHRMTPGAAMRGDVPMLESVEYDQPYHIRLATGSDQGRHDAAHRAFYHHTRSRAVREVWTDLLAPSRHHLASVSLDTEVVGH